MLEKELAETINLERDLEYRLADGIKDYKSDPPDKTETIFSLDIAQSALSLRRIDKYQTAIEKIDLDKLKNELSLRDRHEADYIQPFIEDSDGFSNYLSGLNHHNEETRQRFRKLHAWLKEYKIFEQVLWHTDANPLFDCLEKVPQKRGRKPGPRIDDRIPAFLAKMEHLRNRATFHAATTAAYNAWGKGHSESAVVPRLTMILKKKFWLREEGVRIVPDSEVARAESLINKGNSYLGLKSKLKL